MADGPVTNAPFRRISDVVFAGCGALIGAVVTRDAGSTARPFAVPAGAGT
jgi:hypothetical protein